MNRNMAAIYRILKALESSLDDMEFDGERISANALGITRGRRDSLMAMLAEEGYIDGVTVRYYDNERAVMVGPRPRITLKGLEYLADNAAMARAARAAKGIRDMLP